MIPEFLKKENFEKSNDELVILCEKYNNQFAKNISLDWGNYTRKEWIGVLKKCIKRNKTFEELYGNIEYEEDVEY